MHFVDRSVEARVHRVPDFFLSHSARDKSFVWKLAEDLAYCEVDCWLDEWELQPGESLHEAIGASLEKCKYIAIVIGPNFDDSRWASDEMKQGLARERRENRTVVVPVLAADAKVPPFLEDKVFIDLRHDYYRGIVRLSAMANDIPRQHIEDAIRQLQPTVLSEAIGCLRFAGFEPYVVMSREDAAVVAQAGGIAHTENKLRFSPDQVARHPSASPRLRRLMHRLNTEVWK
jgi:TIR domain